MSQHPVSPDKQFAGHSDSRNPCALAPGNALEESAVTTRSTRRVLCGFDQDPSEPCRALFREVARLDVPTRGPDDWRESGIGHQLLGGGKPPYVSDFGEDQQRGIVAHARQGAQCADGRGGFRLLVDETGGVSDLRPQDVQDL